jgi:hypothetical protein
MASRKTNSKTAARTPADAALTVDLHALLLAALKDRHNLAPKVKWAPSRNYCSLYVAGDNIGYVFKQTRAGVRIEPAAHPADLPRSVKGFKKGTRSERFALVGVVKDEAGIAHAADALAAAAIKQDTERKAKVAATVKPAKSTGKPAAAAPAVA